MVAGFLDTCYIPNLVLLRRMQLAGITIIGGENDGVAACTQTVEDGETISIGKIKIRCIETPLCAPHTLHFCPANIVIG